MKLLFTSYFPLGYGGGEISMKQLAEALQKRKHKVVIASSGSYEGFKTYKFREVRKKRYSAQEKYLTEFFVKIIRKEKIKVIHSHDRLTAVAAILAAEQTGIMSISHYRDYWFACPKSTCLRTDMKVCKGSETGCLLKCSEGVGRIPLDWYKRLYLKRARKILKRANKKIANSESVKKKLEGLGITNNLGVIHPSRKEIKLKISKKEKDFLKARYQLKEKIIAFSGTLTKNKGIHIIAEIIPEIVKEQDNVSFLIIGDGPLRKEVERLSEGKAVLTGRLPHENTLKLFSISDIILLPSIWEEPFSGIILEAAQLGKPLIASKVGGIKDIPDASYLAIHNPLSKKEWKEKIVTLIKGPKFAKGMIKRAQTLTAQETAEKTAKKVEAVYKQEIPTKKELEEYYQEGPELNRAKELGDNLLPKDSSFRVRMAATASMIKQKKEETIILDLGCGIGLYDFYLLKKVPNASILGIDIAKKQIEIALELAKKADEKRIAFKTFDIEKLEEADLGGYNKPHYIIATEILEHLVDPRPMLRKIKTFCGPKTKVIISTPLKFFNEQGDVWYIQKNGEKTIETQDKNELKEGEKYHKVWHKEYQIPEIIQILQEEGFRIRKVRGSLFRPIKSKHPLIYSAMSKMTFSHKLDDFLNGVTGNKYARTAIIKFSLP